LGKRSKLDKVLAREFIKKRVHILVSIPYQGNYFDEKHVALHNFSGGYCGSNAIEDGKQTSVTSVVEINCGLNGSIPEMEEAVLWKKPTF